MKTKATCNRCGGTGHHQFNQVHGTVCYGCSGTGTVLVDLAALARRKAAQASRDAAQASVAATYKATLAAVKATWNAVLGPFDLTTEVGIEKLDRAVQAATGKDLAGHAAIWAA